MASERPCTAGNWVVVVEPSLRGWGQPFEGLGLSAGVSAPQGSYQGPSRWEGP